MKLKKSQIKELIRHTIVDLTEKTFGSKAQYDAYRKKHNLKPGSKHKVDGKTVTVRDVKKISKSAAKSADKFAAAQNAKLDAAEKAMKKKKVKESKMKRYTVKEVRMWMKKLEENRYKKVYNSDARRVAWMVNNEGVEISEMPKSMSKKWTKAQYGRERYLATEFIKSKSEQMTEGKLTEGFKKIAKKNVKYKDKTGTYNWQIESGIDTDVMGGNTPKIILSYQHEDEKGFPTSGGNFFWLKEKDGTPYTPQKAKALVNKISNKKIGDFHRKSTKPSGSGNLIVMKGNKFIREGKLTETKFYAFFNKKKHTIDGKSLYDAKQKAILKLKVPKSKVGMLSIVNAKEHDRGGFRFEQKLRQTIREIIKEQLNEVKFKKVILPNDMKTKIKVSKMIKQLKLKIDKDYDVKALKARGGDQVISILPKHYNKFIELAMKNKLNPRG